jgi:lipopolysaccharide export system protein LptA
MAISNTNILIKRSGTTSSPTSLKSGELAYSYVSNTLFFGTTEGNGVVNVGGQYYTSTVDNATSANTASTLVKRNTNGAFYGRLYGLANSAIILNTARDFSISGGDITASAQSFDGSGNVVLNASLNNISGLTSGQYGSATAVPVISVAANGRITSISTSAISTSINILGDSGGSQTVAGGNTITFDGTTGITTTTSENKVTFAVDNTILRSNTAGGTQVIDTNISISKDLSVTGNLTVLGNTTTINVNDYVVEDPMIYLAGNNYTSDIVNIGFAGNYYDGSVERHTGFYRAHDNKKYYLFDNYIPELSGNNQVDRANTSFRVATLTANIDGSYITNSTISSSSIENSNFTGGTIGQLFNDLSVTDGGTGASSFNAGQIIVGNGSGALQQIANVTTSVTGSLGTTKTITSLTTDAWGRLTAYTASDISGLTVAQGGTGASTFSSGQLIVGNGTGALQALANTGTSGTYGSTSQVPVITTDAYGRVSSVTNTSIAISASAITSGTLAVARGGTNNNTFDNNTLTYFNGSAIVSLANVSYSVTGSASANSTLTGLTVDNFGRTSAATFSAISGLTVPQGGTGIASATTNGIIFGNGTGAFGVTALAGSGSDQTWSNQILTVTNAGVPVWASAMDGGTF